jgi:hypothetical protein
MNILSIIINLPAASIKREIALASRTTQNRPTSRMSRSVGVALDSPEPSLLLCAKN